MSLGKHAGCAECPAVDVGIVLCQVLRRLAARESAPDRVHGDPRTGNDRRSAKNLGVGRDPTFLGGTVVLCQNAMPCCIANIWSPMMGSRNRHMASRSARYISLTSLSQPTGLLALVMKATAICVARRSFTSTSLCVRGQRAYTDSSAKPTRGIRSNVPHVQAVRIRSRVSCSPEINGAVDHEPRV